MWETFTGSTSSPFLPTWLRKLGELEELGQADAGAGMGALLPGAAGPWLVALGLRSSWGQTQGVSEPSPGLAFLGGTADQGGKAWRALLHPLSVPLGCPCPSPSRDCPLHPVLGWGPTCRDGPAQDGPGAAGESLEEAPG